MLGDLQKNWRDGVGIFALALRQLALSQLSFAC
jgi:hypothetical protein